MRKSLAVAVWSRQKLSKLRIFVPLFLLLVLVVPHFIVTSASIYKLAVATALKCPQFAEALGSPVREGWFPEGRS